MKATNATLAQLAFWTLFFKLMVDRGQLGFWSGETALLLSAAVLLWGLCQRRIAGGSRS